MKASRFLYMRNEKMKSALVKNQNALHYIFTFQKVHFPLITLTPFYSKKNIFELAMIGKVQDKYYLNNSLKMNMTFPAYYDQFKKQQLLGWLKNNREDIVGGSGRVYTADGNWISSAYLGISLKSSMLEEGEYLLQMRFKNYSKDPRPIPAGKQNRLTWIENNLENIR